MSSDRNEKNQKLISIYRLDFYKKRNNWALTRGSKSLVDVQGNNDSCTTKENHPTNTQQNLQTELNKTCNIVDSETSSRVQEDPVDHSDQEQSDSTFISSWIDKESSQISSVDSEGTFLWQASLVPHSSQLQLNHDIYEELESPQEDFTYVSDWNELEMDRIMQMSSEEIVQSALLERMEMERHRRRYNLLAQLSGPARGWDARRAAAAGGCGAGAGAGGRGRGRRALVAAAPLMPSEY